MESSTIIHLQKGIPKLGLYNLNYIQNTQIHIFKFEYLQLV
jgi:hypothetical protein